MKCPYRKQIDIIDGSTYEYFMACLGEEAENGN